MCSNRFRNKINTLLADDHVGGFPTLPAGQPALGTSWGPGNTCKSKCPGCWLWLQPASASTAQISSDVSQNEQLTVRFQGFDSYVIHVGVTYLPPASAFDPFL